MECSVLYDTLKFPELVQLAQYCEALSNGLRLPRWSDFRPSQITYLLGRLYVVEVLSGGADYFFRLSGVYMKEIYGSDLAHCTLSSLPDTPLKVALRRNYDEVVASGQPVCAAGTLVWQEGSRIEIERLLVPFAGENGQLHIILGAVQCDAPLEMIQLYRGNGPGLFVPAG